VDDFLVFLLIAVVWILQAVASARRRNAGTLREGGADEPAPDAEQRRRAAEEARRRAEERALRWRRREAVEGEGGRPAAEPEPLSLEVTPRRTRASPSRPAASADPARPRLGPARITGRVRRGEGRDRSPPPTPAAPTGAGRRTGALRRAVLWSEILAAPRALRPYDGGRDPS
jgi:hypothetical protein